MTAKRMLQHPHDSSKQAEATVVKVTEANEPFTYITLEDGTTLTMRMTVLEVVRFIDCWDEDNNPIYSVNGRGSLSIAIPDHLKRQVNSHDS